MESTRRDRKHDPERNIRCRCEPELKRQLRHIATEDKRTLSNTIRMALEEWVGCRKRKK
jgi:predicted transcriptional regulator